jgi:hypothetical protein
VCVCLTTGCTYVLGPAEVWRGSTRRHTAKTASWWRPTRSDVSRADSLPIISRLPFRYDLTGASIVLRRICVLFSSGSIYILAMLSSFVFPLQSRYYYYYYYYYYHHHLYYYYVIYAAESRSSWTSMFGISTFRNWFWRIFMRPRGYRQAFPTILILYRLHLVKCYVSLRKVHCFRAPWLPYTSTVLRYYKNELSCFLCFLRLFYILMTDISYVLGTKQAFYTENEFQCSWRFYRYQLITNIVILLHIVYVVTLIVAQII